jgi:hypothetical protein
VLAPTTLRSALLLLPFLLPGPSYAFPNEPDGFGAARFGMTLDEIKKHFPELKPIGPAPQSSSQSPLTLELYEIPSQPVLGIPNCSVRFYLANTVLYRVAFNCGGDPRVGAALKGRFGPASEELEGNVHWLSEERGVSVNPRDLQFSFTDIPRQRAVLLAVMAHPGAKPVEPLPTQPSGQAASDGEDAAPDREFDFFEDEERLDRALSLLAAAESNQQIASALLLVSSFQEPRTIPILEKYLQHEDELVFEAAIGSLEDLADEAAVRAVGTLLDDPTVPRTRRLRAVAALLHMKLEDGVAEELAKALSDPDVEVRQEAAMNITFTGEDALVITPLRQAYRKETDEDTRNIMSRALELLGASLEQPDGEDDAASRESTDGARLAQPTAQPPSQAAP